MTILSVWGTHLTFMEECLTMEERLRGTSGWRVWPWCWLCFHTCTWWVKFITRVLTQGRSAAVGGTAMSSSAEAGSQPSQDLLHSSYFCLCQVAIWLVAEWITSGCLKLGSIHPSFKKPFMKYPRNSSWAVTKHPKHKSKMGRGGDRNREHSPFVATPFLQICGAGSNFLLRFFSARLCSWGWEPFFWSSSEVGVKIPFLSEGSPVMKRAFHSAWVGPEQRAATLWKAWAKSPLPLLLGRKGGRSPRPSKGGGAAGTAVGLPGCARAELWMQAVEKLGSP